MEENKAKDSIIQEMFQKMDKNLDESKVMSTQLQKQN